MTEIANLVTKLTVEDAQFQASMKKASGSALSLSTSFTAVAAVASAAFLGAVGSLAAMANEITDVAAKISKLYDQTQKIGVSVAGFQNLAVVANEAGVSISSLQTLFMMMNKNLGLAALGTGKTAQALKALGLSMQDLKGLAPEEQFKVIARQLSQIHDITIQTALATKIFGRSAADAVGLFNVDLDKAIDKVKELGATLTQSQAAALDKLSETRDLIGRIWEGFKENVAASLAQPFQDIYERIIKLVKEMGGVKVVAKQVAEGILVAVNMMISGLTRAVNLVKTIKETFDNIMDSFLGSIIRFIGQLFVVSYDITSRLATLPLKLLNVLPAKDQSSSAAGSSGEAAGLAAFGTGVKATSDSVTSKVTTARVNLDAAKAIVAYKDTTQAATAELNKLKDAALKTAAVLDSYKKISNALKAPGQKQADDIINGSVKGLGIQLAPSAEFQKVFTEALKTGNAQNSQLFIEKLQNIIEKEKGKDSFKSSSNSLGFRSDPTGNKQDVSGLIAALDELKVFLAGKDNKSQQVQVNIKVEASQDFITTVTQTSTFKDVVEQKFKGLMEAAARGK